MTVSSPILVVAFGGIANSVGGVPPFEFFRVLDGTVPVKKLFLRDLSQSWYHHGVRGLADDPTGVAVALRRIVTEAQPRKLVMIGASAGGYAALLFGRLLGATEVHAFAPQTFLGPGLRLRHVDYRWRKEWTSLMLSGRYRWRYGNLRRVFNRLPARGGHAVIHYCGTERLDAIHARHLAGQPYVELRLHEKGGHSVVQHLRDTGELQPLLRDLVSL